MITDVEKEAIKLIKNEKEQWEPGWAFVTAEVAFQMREITKRARKNYFGIFDVPIDPTTGLEKIWVPLTEWTVESVVQNADLDTKDINVIALKPQAYSTAIAVRHILFDYFKKLRFGELLDMAMRLLAIDGTVVVKSWKGFDKQLQKKCLKTRIVELLNFYIDPVADSIADANSVIEAAYLTEDEIKGMTGWKNTEAVKGSKSVISLSGDVLQGASEVPMVDVYERWGKMPKYLISGEEEDKNVWIDGVIIVSGLNQNPLVHLIKENKTGKKPYEECWLRRVPGRWQGRGIAEQLFGLQENVNEIFNIRRNNDLLLQNGLFLASGRVTQQMISQLRAGGVIQVKDIDKDLKQLQVQDYRPGSYIAERNIYSLAEKVTFTFPISRGETLPASTPATNAVIQNQNAQNSFSLIKESVGMFLQRLIEKQWLPIILETMKIGDIIPIENSGDEGRALDEMIVNQRAAQATSSDAAASKEYLKEVFRRYGKQRYLEIDKKITPEDLGIHIYITNEDLDKSTLVQNLNSLLSYYSQFTGGALDVDSIAREILDIMGLDGSRFIKQGAANVVSKISNNNSIPRETAQDILPGLTVSTNASAR